MTTKKDVTVIDDKELMSYVKEIGYEDSVTKDDLSMPIIKIVQKGSDNIMEENPDARPGIIYNNATNELLGNEISFVPCAFEGKYLMRVPLDKGGGFGGVFSEKPESFIRQVEGKWYSDEYPDMEVVYTHYHAILLNGVERAVLPMNGTQLKISKKWNILFRKGLDGLPIFCYEYTVKTNDQSAKNFNFKGWGSPVRVRRITLEEMKMAGDFYKFMKTTSNVIEKYVSKDDFVI